MAKIRVTQVKSKIGRPGNSSKIEEWRHEQAIEKTKKRRPDLLDS